MENLQPWENAVLGAVAGPSAMPMFQPFIYWKNTYAILKQPFTFNPRLIYRGLPVSMMLQGPVNGTQFLGTGIAKNMMGGSAQESQSTLSDGQKMAAGMFGGCLSGLICAPQEAIMVQQQKQGGTLSQVAGSIVREHGPLRIMRALPATALREGFYTMGMLSLSGICADKVRKGAGFDQNNPGHEFQARIVGALGGGLTGAVISHPIDFIKTNQQGDIGMVKYRGLFQSGMALSREHGFFALYRGLLWRSMGIIVGTFTINMWKDFYAPLIFSHRF